MTVTVFVCGAKRVDCSSHDCSKSAALRCDFAVKRDGQPATCGRPVCAGCKVEHEGKLLCGAHGRVVKARKA